MAKVPNLQLGSRKQRYWLAFVVVGALLLGGVYFASKIDISQPLHVQTPEGRQLIITEITLGTPIDAAEVTARNPKLRQLAVYSTADPLALRITTDAAVTEPFTVSARLLTPAGAVVELTPTQATFEPGTSSFCCWLVSQPGKYTLQIFRPEKVITSLPLVIKQAPVQPKPLL